MAHEHCDPSANAGKEVTCDGCNRTYIVTVYDDHYCAGFDDNHYCESCLISRGVKAYNDSCIERDSILVQTQTTDGQVIDTRIQQL